MNCHLQDYTKIPTNQTLCNYTGRYKLQQRVQIYM